MAAEWDISIILSLVSLYSCSVLYLCVRMCVVWSIKQPSLHIYSTDWRWQVYQIPYLTLLINNSRRAITRLGPSRGAFFFIFVLFNNIISQIKSTLKIICSRFLCFCFVYIRCPSFTIFFHALSHFYTMHFQLPIFSFILTTKNSYLTFVTFLIMHNFHTFLYCIIPYTHTKK